MFVMCGNIYSAAVFIWLMWSWSPGGEA